MNEFFRTDFSMWSVYIKQALAAALLLFVALDASAQSRSGPGCLREQLYMEQVLGELAAGRLHERIFETLDDPRYNDGNWSKYKSVVIQRHREGHASRPSYRYRIEIHYNRNHVTGAIADFKFVNSLDQGCWGYPISIGDDLAPGFYTVRPGAPADWFRYTVWVTYLTPQAYGYPGEIVSLGSVQGPRPPEHDSH